jgi:hypothetical protein
LKKILKFKDFEIAEATKHSEPDRAARITAERAAILTAMDEIEREADDYASQSGTEMFYCDGTVNFAYERMFLKYRYIYGYTAEKTAEVMNVSRDTVYRIKRRIETQIRMTRDEDAGDAGTRGTRTRGTRSL